MQTDLHDELSPEMIALLDKSELVELLAISQRKAQTLETENQELKRKFEDQLAALSLQEPIQIAAPQNTNPRKPFQRDIQFLNISSDSVDIVDNNAYKRYTQVGQ